MRKLYKVLKFPARTKVFCLVLLWLIMLLIIGTIAQKDMGLYLAHKKYFSSWIFWIFEMFPAPGARLTVSVIFWGLLVKTITQTWTKSKVGTLAIHIGVLLLIFGGFLTAYFSSEGSMVLGEGGSSNFVADYHEVELAVTDSDGKDAAVFAQYLLKSGNKLKHDALNFTIEIEKFCKNCAISLKEDTSLTMPERIILDDAPPQKIEEENISGLRFSLINTQDKQDGRYLSIENIPPITKIIDNEQIYQFSIRHKRNYLPFSIKLIDFEKTVHPTTNIARSYQSNIILSDKDIEWPSIISMNQPLRYKGYTFYQSSVLKMNGQDLSVLAVVKNIGRLFPYISSIIICLGLLIHLLIRLPILMRKEALAAVVFLIIGGTTPVMAEINPQIISTLPIMHEGRIKPIDSFARSWLTSFSGRENIDGLSSSQWLFELLFSPEKAHKRQVFNVANPDIIHVLKLEKRKRHIYSFNEIFPAMRANMKTIQQLYLRDPKENSSSQNQLLELISKIGIYAELERYESSDILRIIPPQWGSEEQWFSPNSILESGQGSPKTVKFLADWKLLKTAYINDNEADWNKISNELARQSYAMSGNKIMALKIETFYNRINFFKQSLIAYIAGFLVLLFGFLAFKKTAYIISSILLFYGASVHVIGLIARMYIMGRPPVSTLYESIVFVGLIAVIFALILEKRNKNSLGLFIGSIVGAILQFIGIKYSAEGDSMGMLSAVLDTNFWLATHVVTITISYGCCIIGSILGHVYLLSKREYQKPILRNMLGVTLIALFFAILGTILGGIWADQSWGRFWGWDPKENGAMLICLWLILLLHGFIAKALTPTLFAMGMVLTNIIVVLAWFGVNLLNVGLHSYGFTENIAQNIALFCSLEILFIGFAMVWIKRRTIC